MRQFQRKVLFGFSFCAVCLTAFVLLHTWNHKACAGEVSKTFKWRMQTIDAPAMVGAAITQPAFCERVRKMSNGRLDITLYTAGQLCPTLEILDSLAKGSVDISYTCGVYYTGAIPEAALELSSLPPMLLKTVADAKQVYWYMGVDDIMREAYAEQGVYMLGSLLLEQPITNWSKKPMMGVADLKGHKCRSFGYLAKTLAELGASPTFIPHEEVYLSLAQGVIDGSMTFGSHYARMKYYEVAPYYYLPGFFPVSSMCVLVSLKSWNALPDDLKGILQDAFVAFNSDHSQQLWWEHEEMVHGLEKLNVKVINWPESELQKVRAAGVSFLPSIAKKNERCAKGIKKIQDYMKFKGYIN
jgi:TRAP-type mannitol/chloroaromatic compound transport system substrate-binding protein